MDDILPTAGTYVVAVSGGVDSVVLLHRLALQRSRIVESSHSLDSQVRNQAAPSSSTTIRRSDYTTIRLIVAHFDHGIREESSEDRRFVEALAQEYGLPFIYDEGRLGAGASEAAARQARYAFLYKTRQAAGARAIITAHHQDDVLETAILNMLRGSGRKGLTALASRHDIVRPFLGIPKRDLIRYAETNRLRWHEDRTNSNDAYLRNYVRHRLVSRFDEQKKQELQRILNVLSILNHQIDRQVAGLLHVQSRGGALDRLWFNHLPHTVAREVMAAWLRAHTVRNFDRKTLERLVVAAKTGQPGQRFPAQQDVYMHIEAAHLALHQAER